MPSARTLTTTELGAVRYSEAISANQWPIVVCLTPESSNTPVSSDTLVSSDIPGPPKSLSSSEYKLVIAGAPDVKFCKTWHKDLRATVTLPIGKHTYNVYHDADLVYSSEIDVQPDEAPLGTTKLASELTERLPSGVTQLTDATGAPATVKYVYAEETHAAREVYAIGDGIEVELQREENGQFVGEGALGVGVHSIRFRVVPREWTRPEVGAFTRLGWDDCAGERGVWVTWPLQVDIKKELEVELELEQQAKEDVEYLAETLENEDSKLGVVLVSVAVMVIGIAFAALIGRDKDAVEVEPAPTPAPATTRSGVGQSGNVAREVLDHMRSTSM